MMKNQRVFGAANFKSNGTRPIRAIGDRTQPNVYFNDLA